MFASVIFKIDQYILHVSSRLNKFKTSLNYNLTSLKIFKENYLFINRI